MPNQKQQNPQIQIMELTKQLAQAQQQLTLTQKSLKAKFNETTLTDEELQAQHDPNNPSAMTVYAKNFADKQEADYQAVLTQVNTDTEAYIATKYNKDELTLQTELAKYTASSGSKLTYDTLTKDTPARIMDDFKSGKLTSYEDLFKATEMYQQNTQTYQPTAPPAGNNAEAPQGAGQQQAQVIQQPQHNNQEVSTDDVLS